MTQSKNVKASKLPLTKKSGGPAASKAGKANDAGLQGKESIPPASSGAVVREQEAARTTNKKNTGVETFGAPAEVGDLKDAPKQDRDLARFHNPNLEDEESTSKRRKKSED